MPHSVSHVSQVSLDRDTPKSLVHAPLPSLPVLSLLALPQMPRVPRPTPLLSRSSHAIPVSSNQSLHVVAAAGAFVRRGQGA